MLSLLILLIIALKSTPILGQDTSKNYGIKGLTQVNHARSKWLLNRLHIRRAPDGAKVLFVVGFDPIRAHHVTCHDGDAGMALWSGAPPDCGGPGTYLRQPCYRFL